MTLGEGGDVFGFKVTDVSFVHDARRDVPGDDELAQPSRRVLVDFIVERGHDTTPPQSTHTSPLASRYVTRSFS
jgi:hypothetical protein